MPAPIFSSPKTTWAAIAILISTIGYVVYEITYGNGLGAVDFAGVIAGLSAAVGFFFSRDGDKSSEDVGIK